MKEQDYNEIMSEMAAARGVAPGELEAEMQAAIDEAWDEDTKSFKHFPSDAHIEAIIRLIAKQVIKKNIA